MPHYFVTGTDTGVGKTWFCCRLLEAWRARGHRVVGLKPIATGDRSDAEALRAAADSGLTLDEINPLFLRPALAPRLAAEASDRVLEFAPLQRAICARLAKESHVLIEGVGGWRVPLARDYEVRDWARDLGLPVLVVARSGLGTLNHTLLTVENIRANGLVCRAVALNDGAAPAASPDLDLVRSTNLTLLRDLLGLSVFQLTRTGQVPVKVADGLRHK